MADFSGQFLVVLEFTDERNINFSTEKLVLLTNLSQMLLELRIGIEDDLMFEG